MPFLLPNQQHQSTEGSEMWLYKLMINQRINCLKISVVKNF